MRKMRAALFECLFGERITWGAILRIMLWALLFFLIINTCFPQKKRVPEGLRYGVQLKGKSVQPMNLPRSDPRGVRTTLPKELEKEFLIGWIGGSSLHTRANLNRKTKQWGHETFVPVEVAKILGCKTEKEVSVALYLLSAQRIFDEYLCLLDALRYKPDLVVITLNPVWAFNSKSLSFWPNLYSATIENGLANFEDLTQIALFGGPSNIAQGLLSRYFPLIRNRFDYRQDPTVKIASLFHERHVISNQYDRLSMAMNVSQPLQFWARFEGGKVKDRSVIGWQIKAMSYIDEGVDGFHHIILRNMIKRVNEAGVKTLFYLAPFTPNAWDDEMLYRKLKAQEHALSLLAREYNSSNIHIISENPARVLPELEYRDLVHIKDSLPLSDYLADEIFNLLEKNGDGQ